MKRFGIGTGMQMKNDVNVWTINGWHYEKKVMCLDKVK